MKMNEFRRCAVYSGFRQGQFSEGANGHAFHSPRKSRFENVIHYGEEIPFIVPMTITMIMVVLMG